MSAPMLDQAGQSRPNPPGRRRRALTLLTAGTLVVAAVGVGVGAALANRPAPTAARQEPAVTTPATQTGTAPQPPAKATRTPAAAPAGTAAQPAAALADGRHDVFIRKLDTRRGTVVVDVVQVFKDGDATRAAIEDGKDRDTARYLPVHVRNQNPRLRTLPLASGFEVDQLGGCEGSTPTREQLLDKLSRNAGIAGVYYYTLTVDGGAVQRIDENLAVNAC
jgi:pyruvate/2-oxoglutarate dehydrogenase complex dihydrolipoamide acyltransferase (E2) component